MTAPSLKIGGFPVAIFCVVYIHLQSYTVRYIRLNYSGLQCGGQHYIFLYSSFVSTVAAF